MEILNTQYATADGRGFSVHLTPIIAGIVGASHRFVNIDGHCVVSLEYSFGEVINLSVERAKLAIESYAKSNKKYLVLRDRFYPNQLSELPIDKLKKIRNFEVFSYQGGYMSIEGTLNGVYLKFCVFDIEMCKLIHQENSKQRRAMRMPIDSFAEDWLQKAT